MSTKNMKRDQSASAWGDKRAKGYDDRVANFIEGYVDIHCAALEQVRKRMPLHGRLLVIGAGTGSECLAFKSARPDIQIVAVEPSSAMLDKAREKLAGFENVSFVEGAFSSGLKLGEFDGATAILVTHFLADAQRMEFLQTVAQSLKPGGFYLSADLFLPVEQEPLEDALNDWAQRMRNQGDSEEQIERDSAQVREAVHFVSQAQHLTWLRQFGLHPGEKLFQGRLSAALIATKPV